MAVVGKLGSCLRLQHMAKQILLSMETAHNIYRPCSSLTSFRKLLSQTKHLVVLTGAGISAESGIPTFRGPGGYWRRWQATDLATPEAFNENPSLIWEFYHYRREGMLNKEPNKAHIAIAECEKRFVSQGRSVTVITQNIDGLHRKAGSENIIELHGNLFKTRCLKCHDVVINTDSPICEALRGKGEPDVNKSTANIPEKDLPRCKNLSCNGLLRPYIVWFGENLESSVLEATYEAMEKCDLCVIIGTSSVVYPAAGFAPELAARGVPVAEFNLEDTPVTFSLKYHFKGPAGETVPPALAHITDEECESWGK